MDVQTPIAVSRTIGFAVAGGRSSRMGQDKALLPWRGSTLLDHALDRLRSVFPDVRILSGPEERYAGRGVPVVIDPLPDAGPIAGLLAALEATRSLGGLGAVLLAVDLPLVPASLLRALAAGLDSHDVVAPTSARGPEPLCAAYSVACLERVRRRIERGDYKMTSFWPEVPVASIEGEALAPFGDGATIFANVNTAGEYERLTRT